MGDSGKRSRPLRDIDGINKMQRRRPNDTEERGNSELVVYRILCPDKIMGSVIGKSGKVINSIRTDTKAKVMIVDPFPGSVERVITIYCYVTEKKELEVDQEFDTNDTLCGSQAALFRVHDAITASLASMGEVDKNLKDRQECRLLVPASQSANIIGKSGLTIKKLRSKTKASIKIEPKDVACPSHSCAMNYDNFLEIAGEPAALKKALYAVSAIMYKFSPREDVPLETTIPDLAPGILFPSDLPIYPASGLYQNADSIISSRSVPSIMGTSHVPDLPGYVDSGNSWPVYASSLPLIPTSGSESEELVFRVLCPFETIGRVIGKGGSTIKSIRQASGSRIDVDDKKGDRDECIITITATESLNDLKSMAVEAVLLLQEKINNEDDESVCMRLLVAAKSLGCIIGKAGSVVNDIRKKTRTDIRISKGSKPKFADSNDELIEVLGEPSCVREALIQITLRLRDDVLKEIDGQRISSAPSESLYSGGSGLPSSLLPSVPPLSSLSYDQRAESGSTLGLLSSSSLYGYGSYSMSDNGYGSLSSFSSGKLHGGLPPSSPLEMMVPANAVGKVMGKGGANIANIRKLSGAMIEVSEAKTSRGDRVAHISGTAEEKRQAENLIQAFIMAI